MENASKALIIAGAILLSILIISLGIVIFQKAKGATEGNQMDEMVVSTFNQKFIQYEGTNVKGTQVNALINQVIQNNVATQEDKSKEVAIIGVSLTKDDNWQGTVPKGGNGTKPTQSSEVGKAMTGKTYGVVCETNDNTGFVESVTITGN